MEEKRHIEIVKERIVDRFIIFSHYKMAKTKVERIISYFFSGEHEKNYNQNSYFQNTRRNIKLSFRK